jgi:hypothetical protein
MTRQPLPAAHLVPAIGALLLAGALSALDAQASPPPSSLVRRIAWSELASRGELKAGTVVRKAGGPAGEALRIENSTGQPQRFLVAVLDKPGIRGKAWSITGTIRYEGVEGAGFLEMWSVLPGGGEYFSRTLAPEGPLAALTGSSGWRPFALPFQAENEAQRPDRLTFGVVLPGRGSVEIGPLELHQGSDAMKLAGLSGTVGGGDPGQSKGTWWNDRTSGRVGAALGSLIGVLGALVGGLAGWGRARGLVQGSLVFASALGVLLLIAGVFALGARQPSGVFAPLLLAGALLGVLGPLLLRTVRSRYREFELRRITAFDTAR